MIVFSPGEQKRCTSSLQMWYKKNQKIKSIFWTLSAIVVVRELLVAIYYRSEADQRKCSAFCPVAFKWDQGFSFCTIGQKY